MTDERQGANYVQIEGDVDPSITSTTASSQVAPSTDEGEAWDEYRRALLRLWTSSRGNGANRLASVEIAREHVEAAIRAPLERDVEVARMYAAGVEGMLQQVRIENRAAEERIQELEAELNGTVETYMETTGDMGAEVLELRAEVERLREALRKSANDVLWVHRRLEHYLAPWDSDEEARILRDAHSALATPPSSTEGTKEVEG